MASMRKESNASVAVCIKDPVQKQKYTAIAEPDGRLRGRADEAETGVIANGIVLEVTQKLSVRGDYTSVVCGTNIEDSVCQYFSTSQQTTARCHLACTQDTYLCLIVEQFPITDPEHEQYRNSAQEEWEFLEPLRQQPITDGTVIEPLDKYTEVQLVPLKFGCTCTRRSLGRALSALSQQERQNIADENGVCRRHLQVLRQTVPRPRSGIIITRQTHSITNRTLSPSLFSRLSSPENREFFCLNQSAEIFASLACSRFLLFLLYSPYTCILTFFQDLCYK